MNPQASHAGGRLAPPTRTGESALAPLPSARRPRATSGPLRDGPSAFAQLPRMRCPAGLTVAHRAQDVSLGKSAKKADLRAGGLRHRVGRRTEGLSRSAAAAPPPAPPPPPPPPPAHPAHPAYPAAAAALWWVVLLSITSCFSFISKEEEEM